MLRESERECCASELIESPPTRPVSWDVRCGVGALLRARVCALVATDRAYREWLRVLCACVRILQEWSMRDHEPQRYALAAR